MYKYNVYDDDGNCVIENATNKQICEFIRSNVNVRHYADVGIRIHSKYTVQRIYDESTVNIVPSSLRRLFSNQSYSEWIEMNRRYGRKLKSD